jgi:hypothetical protein
MNLKDTVLHSVRYTDVGVEIHTALILRQKRIITEMLAAEHFVVEESKKDNTIAMWYMLYGHMFDPIRRAMTQLVCLSRKTDYAWDETDAICKQLEQLITPPV